MQAEYLICVAYVYRVCTYVSINHAILERIIVSSRSLEESSDQDIFGKCIAIVKEKKKELKEKEKERKRIYPRRHLVILL